MEKWVFEIKKHNPSEEVINVVEEICIYAGKQEQRMKEAKGRLALFRQFFSVLEKELL
ncbi:hypothetical protein [Pseudalkalibacillus hwajinpoensis]|uniref:hypothetical protein n=1 Tax=Guptibacillus hwajinpoensis TaxID=208199 RepID=UPI001CFCD26A|nr:hypothetical protein [Pseudalkalibacillus hwajinpoensis]